MAFSKPEGIILVHAGSWQGANDTKPDGSPGISGTAVFGIWPSGLIRNITVVELKAWGVVDSGGIHGDPAKCDYVLDNNRGSFGDREYVRLQSYDRALRDNVGDAPGNGNADIV